MPIYLKSKEFVCYERAESDFNFYFGEIFQIYEQNKEDSIESKIDFLRIINWKKIFISYAFSWHKKHYEQASDIFVNKQDDNIHCLPDKCPEVPLFCEITDFTD